MLRTFGIESKWTSVSLKACTDKLTKPLTLGAAAFLMTKIQPAAGLAPFGWALLAAALAAGVQPLFLLAGCLAGAVSQNGFQWGIAGGTATVLAGAVLAELADRICLRRTGRSFLQRPSAQEAAAALLAGVGTLVPGIPLAAGGAWQSLCVIASGVAAAAGAPFMMAWIGVSPARRHLMPGERTGLMIFLCAALGGLAKLQIHTGVAAAYAGALVCAQMSSGAGACAGLVCGGVLTAMGGPPGRAAALGICGLAAGAVCGRKRWASALTLAACAPPAALLAGLPYWESLCALAACGGVLAVPGHILEKFRGRLSGERGGACDPDRLALRLRAETGRRLRALGEAFGELAEGYRLPADIPDEQTLIADMRDHLCENCSNYAHCWAGGDNRAVRFLCGLISEAIEWANGDCAEPLFSDEPPPDVLRACRRGKSIPARLGVLLEDFARTRKEEMKRRNMNRLISAQFMQAQLLLSGMADAHARPMRVRGRQAARARAALDRAGVGVEDVMALRGARSMEIVVTLRGGRWSAELADCAAAHLSRVFGRIYAPSEGSGSREMKFVRLPQMRASASACCHSCRPGAPCGDSHMIRMLEGDRLLLMLSDGMGSGEAAARESAQTLRLLWQFLSADVSRDLALETVNELMLARSGEDMFATVDLCVVDLIGGIAEFTKLAASRSLILRDGEVFEIEGGRLPLGILEQVRPSVCRVRLMPGDVILMGSDGVMDAADDAALDDCLLTHGEQPPAALAEKIVTAVERFAPAHRDDMTAIIAKIA